MMKRIITSTDFRKTLSSDATQTQIFGEPNPFFEHIFRYWSDQIFVDLEYVDYSDQLMVANFLDSIQEPLSQLQKLQWQIVEIQGKVKHPFGILNVSKYYIAPQPCYFQLLGTSDLTIHKLGANNCLLGSSNLFKLDQFEIVKTWFSQTQLAKDFENQIPWCPECLMYDGESAKETYKPTEQEVLEIISTYKQRQIDEKLSTHNLKNLIELGENETQEFKQTLRYDIEQNIKKSPAIIHATLKTIAAFLNTHGGILLIGVRDKDKAITGISNDGFESDDEFLITLSNLIDSSMGATATLHIWARIVKVDNQKICMVVCEASTTPVFLLHKKHMDREIFYIRSGPKTIELADSEKDNYIKKRFH